MTILRSTIFLPTARRRWQRTGTAWWLPSTIRRDLFTHRKAEWPMVIRGMEEFPLRLEKACLCRSRVTMRAIRRWWSTGGAFSMPPTLRSTRNGAALLLYGVYDVIGFGFNHAR